MQLKEVDGVEITCLVDNTVDVLLPSTTVAHRLSLAKNWYERPLIAEHGFSAAVTVEIDGISRRLLLDSGLDPFTAAHNADVLAFDLSNCDAVVSSHGHVDHAGGLLNIRKKMDAKQKVPLVLHEDAFRNRMVKFPDGRTIDLPAPDKSLLAQVGYDIVEEHSQSILVSDRILVSGEIPRTNNFEKGFPIHYSELDGRMLRSNDQG